MQLRCSISASQILSVIDCSVKKISYFSQGRGSNFNLIRITTVMVVLMRLVCFFSLLALVLRSLFRCCFILGSAFTSISMNVNWFSVQTYLYLGRGATLLVCVPFMLPSTPSPRACSPCAAWTTSCRRNIFCSLFVFTKNRERV